jgi:FlaA1/EpsC-like NDP-sugar epimerase
MSGRRDIDIVYTGLRPGEKLGEELFSLGEQPSATQHPLVSRVDVPRLEALDVVNAGHSTHDAAASWMREQSSGQPVTSAAGGG